MVCEVQWPPLFFQRIDSEQLVKRFENEVGVFSCTVHWILILKFLHFQGNDPHFNLHSGQTFFCHLLTIFVHGRHKCIYWWKNSLDMDSITNWFSKVTEFFKATAWYDFSFALCMTASGHPSRYWPRSRLINLFFILLGIKSTRKAMEFEQKWNEAIT